MSTLAAFNRFILVWAAARVRLSRLHNFTKDSASNSFRRTLKSSKVLNSSPILKSAVFSMNECSRELIDRIKDQKRQYYSLGVQAITE